MRLSVVIPCYNEHETFPLLLERALAAPLPEGVSLEIIVVDDGSDARMHDIYAKTSTLRDPRVRFVQNNNNGGKGMALKCGFKHVTGDYVLIQDADLECDPSNWQRILAPVFEKKATFVIGTRNRGMTEGSHQPLYYFGAKAMTMLFNILFGTHFTDVAMCYKLFPSSLIPETLKLPGRTFSFDVIELPYLMARRGNVEEVPVTYVPRTSGEGKKLRMRHGIYCALSMFRILFFGIGGRDIPLLRFVRFLMSGVAAAATQLIFLYILTEYVRFWYLAASIIAFMLGYLVSFLLQKFWTFRSKEVAKIKYQLPLHLLLGLFNLVFNTFFLYALVEWAGIWYLPAQILTLVIIATESFFISRLIFR